MARAQLTLSAVTGLGQSATLDLPRFMNGDVGRQLIIGAGRAMITGFTSTTVVTIDIIDDFASVGPHPGGTWFLRFSPQAALDMDKKGRIGAKITLTADKDCFRSADVGKFIHVYGGVARIVSVNTTKIVTAEVLAVATLTDKEDPDPAPAGTWTLEESSWSPARGFPRTGEFLQGRLTQASTRTQPTTFWMSAPDDFDNYAVGAEADDAVEYTHASRRVNNITWLADFTNFIMGTSGGEFKILGPNQDDPIGGDTIPAIRRFSGEGSAPIQAQIANNHLVFVDRSRKKIFSIAYDLEQDNLDSLEVTGIADHITSTGIRLGPMAVSVRPDPRVYFVRSDGQIIVLTIFMKEKVIGFTRFTTEGFFEAVCVVPQPAPRPDRVFVVARRRIDNADRRYVECFEPESIFDRPWPQLNTDSAITYKGPEISTVIGLEHLEGLTVDVIANGSYIGTREVHSSQISIDPATEVEVGLHYESRLQTMRPVIEGSVIEGMPRSWDTLWARLNETVGGKINGEWIEYPPSPLNRVDTYTGDVKVTGTGWTQTGGRVDIVQTQPYPMTVLALFGTLSVGDHD